MSPEGDFLEVQFSEVSAYMRETVHDALMELWTSMGTSSVLVFCESAGS